MNQQTKIAIKFQDGVIKISEMNMGFDVSEFITAHHTYTKNVRVKLTNKGRNIPFYEEVPNEMLRVFGIVRG